MLLHFAILGSKVMDCTWWQFVIITYCCSTMNNIYELNCRFGSLYILSFNKNLRGQTNFSVYNQSEFVII